MIKKHLIIMFSLACVGISLASIGGPDEFGYLWVDSDEYSGIAFNWIELCSTGTHISLYDDDYETIVLAEPFFYYGNNYNEVHICSNGWISFSDAISAITVGPFPNSYIPNNVLGILNMDLDPSDSPGGGVYYQFIGSKLVIEYFRIREYPGGTSYPPCTYEIILNFRTNTIIFQYLDIEPVISSYRVAYIGVENETGTIGLQYGEHRRDTSNIHDNLTILFFKSIILIPFYFNDFNEGHFPFLLEDELLGEWEWGTPEGDGPGEAHSIPYCFGTNVDGLYSNPADYTLFSPLINLTTTVYPYVEFWHWFETEANKDGGNICISIDSGATWEILIPDERYPVFEMDSGSTIAGEPAFSGHSDGWELVHISLEPYEREVIKLKFHFGADRFNNFHGWYIDDFKLAHRYGSLSGNVELLGEETHGNVLIEIPDLAINTLTDEYGNYMIDSMLLGDHTVFASKGHFLTVEKTGVTITEYDTTFLDFILHPDFGHLRGNVDLLYNDIDEGVIVEIVELGRADTTDIDGYYLIDTLETGTYHVEISKPYYVTFVTSGVVISELDTAVYNFEMMPDLYESDFELDDGYLEAEPPDSGWEWGIPDFVHGPTSAYSGSKCWGTNIDGYYRDSVNWMLDMNVFLGITEYPAVRFMQWYKFIGETSFEIFEGGNLKISVDAGSSWTVVVPVEGYDKLISGHNIYLGGQPAFGGMENGNYWHQVNFDLTFFSGEAAIIRFEIGTDNYSNAAGWYVDDLELYDLTGLNDMVIKIPDKLALVTYPNPFNATLNLNFAIDRHGPASLEVYDLLGKKVGTVFNEKVIKGVYRTIWEMPEEQPSGIYFVKLTVQDQNIIKKVLLLR
ncbi:T9SS type A sorting domain-containing protein [bacterium]|nr:T9SS type A sorting domain-containing protein [bacterium]